MADLVLQTIESAAEIEAMTLNPLVLEMIEAKTEIDHLGFSCGTLALGSFQSATEIGPMYRPGVGLIMNNLESASELDHLTLIRCWTLILAEMESASEIDGADPLIDGFVLALSNIESATRLDNLSLTACIALSLDALTAQTQLSLSDVIAATTPETGAFQPHIDFAAGVPRIDV